MVSLSNHRRPSFDRLRMGGQTVYVDSRFRGNDG